MTDGERISVLETEVRIMREWAESVNAKLDLIVSGQQALQIEWTSAKISGKILLAVATVVGSVVGYVVKVFTTLTPGH